MSEDLENQIKILINENENLKNQLAHNNNAVQSLVAQLEAYKQQLNENLSSLINVRANIILLQKANKELTDTAEHLKKEVAGKTNY